MAEAWDEDFKLLLHAVPNGTYFLDSAVSGAVVLTTNEAKEYKAVQVSLTASSHVKWEVDTSSDEHSSSITYRSCQNILDVVTVVWDKNKHGGGGTLPAGSYRWPFSFILQGLNVPPSYEDDIGKIRYTVQARIVKGGFLRSDTIAEAILTIGNVVRLDRPHLLQPRALSVEKTLCCLCCASTPIRITARIPRTGYCIQQDAIPLEVEIENGSNREVRNLTAIIKRIVEYTAEGQHTRSFKTIANAPRSDPIPARSTQVWKPEPLQVPYTETSFSNCLNISLSYVVEVCAYISFAENPKIEIPILLGNVPLPDAPADSAPSAPGLDYVSPFSPQATPNSGYPPPASAPYPSSNSVPGGQQDRFFVAPSQPTIMESRF